MSVIRNKTLTGSLTVSRISRDVKINRTRLEEFASHLDRSKLAHWTRSSPVKFSDLPEEERLAFLFVFNAISFSYYGNPNWKVEFGGQVLERGTWSMLAALRKGVDDGSLELESNALRMLSLTRFREILRGVDGIQIPMVEERFRILSELSGAIAPFRFRAFIIQAAIENDGRLDALSLVDYILSNIPSFTDKATYEGVEVPFNKRVQLLVSDIRALMSSDWNFYAIRGVDELTACADYILPMVLRFMGILEYSPELSGKVDQKVPLVSGGLEEVEIRANTIVAVYTLSEILGISQMQLNDYFWNLGPEIPGNQEHHLINPRTTAY